MTDIIIPHFGTGRLTELCIKCLQTIREHTDPSAYRLLLVDNASPEFEAIRPELERHPHLLVRNTTNLGFVKATNQGLALSTAPYVVLMNNDTEAVHDWLQKLTYAFEFDPEVGIAGPLTTAQGSWQGRWQIRGETSVPYILGPGRMLAFFCCMFSRKVIETVGFQHEEFGKFGGFGGDDYYCHVAQEKGFKLALVQNLTIAHHHRSTFKEVHGEDRIADMQKSALALFLEKSGHDKLPTRGEAKATA